MRRGLHRPQPAMLFVLLGLAIVAGVPAAWGQEEIYVTNFSGNSITVYERTSNGDVAPVRVIQGPATGLNHPIGVVVDAVHDELVVASSSGGIGVTVYARSASGNAALLRSITGQFVTSVAVDLVHDEILALTVTSVLAYARTANGLGVALRSRSAPTPATRCCR